MSQGDFYESSDPPWLHRDDRRVDEDQREHDRLDAKHEARLDVRDRDLPSTVTMLATGLCSLCHQTASLPDDVFCESCAVEISYGMRGDAA